MLWLAHDAPARFRALLAAGEPTLVAIAAWARGEAARDPATVLVRDPQRPANLADDARGDDHVVGCALTALLDQDRAAARRALDTFLFWTAHWNPSDLGAANQALHGAVAWDCCAALWDDAQRAAAADRLATLHRGFREINNGNPHTVTNNWWAVTHGGALVAALAAHGQRGADGGRHDLAEGIAWARGRLDAFATHFGDGGLYHEGLGYQGYTCSLLLPALLADGGPLLPNHPGLRAMAAGIATGSALAPAASDRGEGGDDFGMLLSWNDAGLGWWHVGAYPCALALAPATQRGALRWFFDRITGVAGPRRFAGGHAGRFFTLVGYPFDVPAVPPEGALPRSVRDGRQGLLMRRSRWQDGDDVVLGAYAKTTWVGGHRQDDAGSIRLIALGQAWIVGGGQARGERDFQSVCAPIGQGTPGGCGALLWDDPRPEGGSLGMDLRKVSSAYHERYLAAEWSGAPGVPAVLALLDQADDHLGRDWRWTLSFLPHQRCELHADGAGFTLRADDARLDARFLAARPRALALGRMPDSKRTYSGGGTVAYPGRPYVIAEFAPTPRLAVYVAMTVTRGEPPPLTLAEEGTDLLVGAWRWRRPFGAAIPDAWRPGTSGGLCKAPAGVDGYQARARP